MDRTPARVFRTSNGTPEMPSFDRFRRSARAVSPLAMLAFASSCSGAGGLPLARQPSPAGGTLGIDTSIYPGDAAMRAWRTESPYRWTGYFLAAPCHRDPGWTGRRAALEQMGWGTAVVYVGQQDWTNASRAPAAAPAVPAPADSAQASAASQPSAAPAPACSASLLTAAQGTAEADDAIAKTAAEGFPRGTAIFLDVERVQTFSPALDAYVRGWTARVLADGRYAPAIYGHAFNAPSLYGATQAVYAQRGTVGRPRFWLASTAGFGRDRAPTDVGYPYADVWQGEIHTRETWGGYPLLVDVNVSINASPSAG
ncbi:MAG: hypothetical protein JWM27_3127 [Gemmatimonadetes bacterium]|nr:hypothetical protein [Gemmatimonadota bacterium]